MQETNMDIRNKSRWISAKLSESAVNSGFYFTEAGKFQAGNGYFVKRDGRDDYMIFMTVSGTGIIKTGDKQLALKSAHAALIDCREYHEYRAEGEWTFYWIHINGRGVSSMADGIMNTDISPYDPREFEKLFEKVLEKGEDIKKQYEVGLLVHTMLCRLTDGTAARMRGGSAEIINDAVSFIEREYAEQISVDDMLELVHMSKYHFIRQFKKYIGVTPYDYLLAHRINMSKRMLRETAATIAEVSEKCGFLDESNYISQFKRRVGITPSQYRSDFCEI